MKTLIILSLFMGLATSVQASENDSLTGRYEKRPDTLEFFNNYMNEKLDHIAKKANKSKKVCNEKKLLKAAKRTLVADVRGMYVFSPTQRMLDRGKVDLELKKLKMRESIYKYVKPHTAPVLKLFSLSPTVNFNGNVLGSDKFSHFFNLGWEYFNKLKKGKKSLEEILSYSKKLEEKFWGGPTTGVISYADLMANFQGLRFFGHLSGIGNDPLTGEDNVQNRYIECREDKWVRVKNFDWRIYFDAFIDEGINCNTFFSKKVEDAVNRKVLELEEDGNNYSCPIRPEVCNTKVEKYGELAKHLISPKCY